jgi:hypothetical protein
VNVELWEGLKKIGENAFYSCKLLQDIEIPLSVKIIDNEAFISCSQLTNVQLGEGLKKIGERAFAECT